MPVYGTDEIGKKQVKTERNHLEESRRKKSSVEELRWEKAHITEELKEKAIQYDNLGSVAGG
ncbi:MAG: hypothetical protein ACLS4P_00770 [Dorea sp.]